ncbi:MAG TPA: hypothetical protein VNZ45_14900 [Bacteroidia bacterium]|nr:hypothetical protein [Bacteroidia bacterium]
MSNQIEMKQRIRCIAVQLENGQTSTEIIRDYSVLWNTSERTIVRYIALAKDIVMDKLNNEDAIIEAVRGAIISEEAEQNLRSNLELEAMLISIMESEMQLEKVITKIDGTTEIKSRPSRKEIIKIIDLLWRRRGIFNLHKTAQEKTEINNKPIIKVENEEQKKLVEKVSNLP